LREIRFWVPSEGRNALAKRICWSKGRSQQMNWTGNTSQWNPRSPDGDPFTHKMEVIWHSVRECTALKNIEAVSKVSECDIEKWSADWWRNAVKRGKKNKFNAWITVVMLFRHWSRCEMKWSRDFFSDGNVETLNREWWFWKSEGLVIGRNLFSNQRGDQSLRIRKSRWLQSPVESRFRFRKKQRKD
jgi:hypothetical protein